MKNYFQFLIVDDDNTNNLICKFTIKRFDKDAVIITYNKPEDALEFLKSDKFTSSNSITILFLDVNMPTMTGFDFLRTFGNIPEEIQNKVKIFMLTSSIEDYSSQAVVFPRIKGFFAKPLKLTYLEQIFAEMEKIK
ncbi:MAG TPA: response regulator [Salinimicrobium catena]|uniref:Response regulator n=1 Tax=Salinimicrobium catena TaxID=390640 RepID=A0A7C2M3X7_9FLAO|nr:response regulator [Salinimicrobium catena]